jgi:hypothetical protein
MASINSEFPKVNRLTWLICGIVLLLVSPYALVAQHRGGRGASGGRPAGASTTDDLKDFKRALALQATPEQEIKFQQLTQDAQAARQNVQDFRQLAVNAKSDLFHDAKPLNTAVEKAQADTERFLESLSAVQKSGLRNEIKKLGKANSDITKESKDLSRGLGHPRIDSKQIAGVVEKLDSALIDFQTKQLAVGSAMGIQVKGTPQ